MSDDDRVFVFVGTYSGTEDAEADYEVVKRLHSDEVIASTKGRPHSWSSAGTGSRRS